MLRELVDRFAYRYRLWAGETQGDKVGAGVAPFTRPVLALCISDLAGALQNAHLIASYGVPGLRASSVKTSRNLPRLRPANRFRHGDVLSDFLDSFRGDVFRLYHFRAASDH